MPPKNIVRLPKRICKMLPIYSSQWPCVYPYYFYDSYRKWTPHYSFISCSHTNNQVIESLTFKKSLWDYLSLYTSTFFLSFFFFNNGIPAKRSVLVYKKNYTKEKVQRQPSTGICLFTSLRSCLFLASFVNTQILF